ncbi:class F sortase [Marisediminicola sp. LYQ134]|uniref:class F sortase n=1 Tax=unclassified Marisediminicola TaxID=2618316 RepID=UPI0039832F06
MTRARTAASTTSRRRGRGRAPLSTRSSVVGILGVAIVVALAGCSPSTSDPSSPAPTQSAPTESVAPEPSAPAPDAAADTSPTVEPALGDGVVPARVSLPTIGVDSALIDLGIQADGTLEVPVDFDDIGWFTGGGKPGGRGPTVVAAHVDSPSGPAAFVRLGELENGDRFTLTGVDGTDFEYEVYDSANYAKAEFPTTDVFGAVADDEVRLITCTGFFDTTIGHYDDNLVVSAVRVLPE